jgi:hypothetical protein
MFNKMFFITVCFFSAITCFSQSCKYNDYLEVLRNKGYSISKEIKVSLSEDETGYYWKTFAKGLDYIIVAASDDEDVSDVDLYLYDDDGSTLKVKDTDVSSLAVVSFTPNYERSMKIIVKNYKSSTPSFSSTLRFIVAYQ